MNNKNLYSVRKVFFFILNIILPQFRFNIIIMFLVALIWAIDLSYRKYLIKNILDTAIQYKEHSLVEHIALPIVLYIFMALLVTTAFRLYGYFVDIRMVPMLRQKIGNKVFTILLDGNHSYYQEHFVGSLTHKINNVTDSTIELIKLFIDRFCGCTIALVLAIYTLSLVNIKFAVATIIWVIIFITVSALSFKRLGGLSSKYSRYSTKVTANIADTLTNIQSVRLFASQIYEKLKLFRIYKFKIIAEQKMQFAYFWLWFVYGYSFDLLQALSLYFLIEDYQVNKILVGDIALVIGINIVIVEFLNQLTHNLTEFSHNFGKVADALSSIDSIMPYSHKTRMIGCTTENLYIKKGKIEFKDVSFGYANKDLLFQNLSLTINPYEKVGIVGYSGSGKSSFINLILRLFEIDSGIIRIDDQSIRNVPLNSLRQQISVIPQDLILFHDTILENIRYSNTYATEEEILNAAKMAGLHNFVLKLPNGYKTKVGNNGLALSGGEKQRIIIARILLKNTPILIFDEPTNQLDSITEQEIQANLLALINYRTTIIIAHRLHTIVNMDRILVFDGGKIVQDGRHYDLLSKPGLYKTLWDTQNDEAFK